MDESNTNTQTPTPVPTILPPGGSTPLPSFSSLRRRNLQTLYGNDDKHSSTTTNNNNNARDKSPKGSVDEKILPLVNLINAHPEYVTLSSCSGRVALFDPGVNDEDEEDENEEEGNGVEEGVDLDGNHREGYDNQGIEMKPNKPNDHLNSNNNNNNASVVSSTNKTNMSGKGRGKWIFVTHDQLPDMGTQIIHSIQKACNDDVNHDKDGGQIILRRRRRRKTLTLKHEPPLLHIAASTLAAGKRMLHLLKSDCAMRESGLVVTDSRVTIEVRSLGGSLCIPVFVEIAVIAGDGGDGGDGAAERVVKIQPNEEYLQSLAKVMNERMRRNESLLAKLYSVLENELFCVPDTETTLIRNDSCIANDSPLINDSCNDYEVELHPLPSLNMWKTAAVVLPHPATSPDDTLLHGGSDLDVLAFGGQGIGPYDSSNGNTVKNTTCQRMDAVFRLKRRGGVWSHKWDTVKLDETFVNNTSMDSKNVALETKAGTFRVDIVESLGRREGHAALVLPRVSPMPTPPPTSSDVVVIFGGRTGGPLSPTKDLFLFSLHHCHRREDVSDDGVVYGSMYIPTDVRGAPPEARYGHSMTALQHDNHDNEHLRGGEALAIVAGGMGVSETDSNVQVVFSSVYILSRCKNDDSESFHFIWERIADMIVPRSYHSAIRIPLECSNGVLVFGGISKADDPFDDEDGIDSGPPFEILGCGKSTWVSDSSSKECDLPFVIGGSSVPLTSASSASATAFLVIGGTKPCTLRRRHEEKDTIGIFRWASNDNGSVRGPIKANATILQNEGNCDLGVCVHHCLVDLPTSTGTSDASNVISSAVSVGGGVPSFSFGQSFSTSFLINVKCSNSSIKGTPYENKSSLYRPMSAEKQEKDNSSSSIHPEADVVYVSNSNAKKVKVELESLGYLDKRFKMVKVLADGTNLIAIPITDSCLSYLKRKGNRSDCGDGSQDNESAYMFETLIVNTGRESVPLSSSSMGKLKQRR
ncbi:hypothetical protein HJC23_009302 [Cyclotella cryptica]|uniref:tRNA(Phe) 7-[(3-amino-3-carboxypropyl)-4-demethylwyosine(37)-N(4)]-methyltransferase n=1 Tax=Cyclotella cryptica TaxID=29204 RepID=A0ABD3QT01_9STRA|eukprot:CCRYP_002275-RA/>CCRYP_002275-RA protein AED:0.04 eAED:0.04 QI:0/1/0.5/1/1/1/2/103/980